MSAEIITPEQFKKSIDQYEKELTRLPEVVAEAFIEHNDDMTVSKDLLDAKLETIETRMDGRIATIEATITATNQKIDILSADVKSSRATIITTIVGAAFATAFGIGAFNATLLSNMVASYDSGKNTAETIAKATAALDRQQEELKKIQQDMILQNASYKVERDKPKAKK